jgi:hypothetical protein
LKTTFAAVELALSLGTGKAFLDTFPVPRSVRVAVISGESGEYTLQETARRIARVKGIHLPDANVLWDFDLPSLADPAHLAALCDGIESHEIEVLILDPLYLCLLAGIVGAKLDASNLYQTGPLFRAFAKAVLSRGCTPILLHHTPKHVPPGEPLDLDQLAYAGVSEFSRQWILLNRRERYDPDSPGSHKLWLSVGGSAGQSGLWAVDVEEGTLEEDFSGRKWEVTVTSATAARSEMSKQVRSEKDGKKEEQRCQDDDAVIAAIDALLAGTSPATQNAIRGKTALPSDRVRFAVNRLLGARLIEEIEVMVPSGKNTTTPRTGYRRPLRDQQD